MAANRIKRHKRIRSKVSGTINRPRVAVFRSNKHIHIQLINDDENKTILGMSTSVIESKGNKTAKAEELGKKFAESVLKKLKSKKQQVVFDRGGYKFHGRIKALAEAMRQNGFEF